MVRIDVYLYTHSDVVVISDGKRHRYLKFSKHNADDAVNDFIKAYHEDDDGVVKYWYR